MADPQFRANLPTLDQIRAKSAEELNALDLVKGYFVLSWLMEERPEQLVDYVRTSYKLRHEIREKTPEDEAFQRAFQRTGAELEAEFELWARTIPPTPPL